MRLAVCVIFVGLFLSPLGATHRIFAAMKGDKELLSLVADVYRGNKGRIQGWSGQILVTDTDYLDGQQLNKTESKVEFVADTSSRQLRWDWNVRSKEGDTTRSKLTMFNGLLNKDGFAFVRQDVGERAPIKTIEIVPRNEFSAGPLSNTFDPMYFLGYRGEDVADRFRMFHDHYSEPGLAGWTVSRQVDLVTLEYENNGMVNRYIVDLAQGGTLLRYEASSPTEGGDELLESEKMEWTYEYANEVWVPKTTRYEKLERFEVRNGKPVLSDHERRATREIKWIDNRINERISDDEFDLNKLGIRDGDVIADKLTGTTYRYNSPANQSPHGRNLRAYFIVANVIILIAMIFRIVRNRLKKATTR